MDLFYQWHLITGPTLCQRSPDWDATSFNCYAFVPGSLSIFSSLFSPSVILSCDGWVQGFGRWVGLSHLALVEWNVCVCVCSSKSMWGPDFHAMSTLESFSDLWHIDCQKQRQRETRRWDTLVIFEHLYFWITVVLNELSFFMVLLDSHPSLKYRHKQKLFIGR